jgi:alpha-tubulin suppressor-like RCC1 family protein
MPPVAMIDAAMVAYPAAMPTRISGLLAAVAVIASLSPAAGAAGAASAATVAPARAPQPPQSILAWGSNAYGELGNGTTTDSSTPAPVQHLPSGAKYTTVRCVLYSLAVTTSGQVYAWGINSSGELGDGTTTNRLTPVQVKLPKGVKVTTVRAGGVFALALTSTGKIYAWGYNAAGELGNGTTKTRLKPVPVTLPKGVTVKAISAGDENGLALTSTGRVLSWGAGSLGQLGDGSTKARLVPGYVKLPAHTTATSIAAGSLMDFAATSAGKVLAWGSNSYGLGDGTTKQRNTPVLVKLPKGVKVVAATAGLQHVLAVTTGGRVLAWGLNMSGQLGDGTTTNRLVPVFAKLPAGTKVRQLAAGKYYSMALTAKGTILAWGNGSTGDLGDGSTGSSPTPVTVDLPTGWIATAIGAGFGTSTGLAVAHPPPCDAPGRRASLATAARRRPSPCGSPRSGIRPRPRWPRRSPPA